MSEQIVSARPAYRPFGLLAELTYTCPLHCPYCSNPPQIPSGGKELSTSEWLYVLQQASELGVLHIHFSGGEPLLRSDLCELINGAHTAGMYTNLITSGIGLTQTKVQALQNAGLDSVQISFQAAEAEDGDRLAGARAHERKLAAARFVRNAGMPLTVNVVLHRRNVESLPQIIALAERLDAQRLELAHTQYLGWAFLNRNALFPTPYQVEQARQIAEAAITRLRGQMEIVYVLPDYYGERPKPCMHGWGQRYLCVTPGGDVLPCQTATVIQDLCFDNIRQHSLTWIWHESSAFQRFRGSAWMPEPCRSCELREIDFGGCRCQAFLLTGDAARTDPACQLSPDAPLLREIVKSASPGFQPLSMRQNPIEVRL
ncbi:MAG TPA: pyrroloquinoline quinone biosynthesis protein PqqE [Ktedonobacteraceae bacterium]|nr:pyrroloquinoline quinone biosynthesis protein PqqE [Ktedonobacteraceae bacterium]